jgi:hypothetical protein
MLPISRLKTVEQFDVPIGGPRLQCGSWVCGTELPSICSRSTQPKIAAASGSASVGG